MRDEAIRNKDMRIKKKDDDWPETEKVKIKLFKEVPMQVSVPQNISYWEKAEWNVLLLFRM